MRTSELLKEIERLPVKKRIYVVEKTLRSIRKNETTEEMQIAAEALYTDYQHDKNLTAFTDLDFEKFYETR